MESNRRGGVGLGDATLQCGDEVLLHIFSFLSPKQLLSSISLVCERWNRVAGDRLLWRAHLCNCFAHLCNLRAYLQSYSKVGKEPSIIIIITHFIYF